VPIQVAWALLAVEVPASTSPGKGLGLHEEVLPMAVDALIVSSSMAMDVEAAVHQPNCFRTC
jgi:hypothetical protein